MLTRLCLAGLLAAALVAGLSGVPEAHAQKVEGASVAWRDVPLETALYELADYSGASFVFAHRLVERLRVSGSYKIGEEADAALAGLLAGSGLRAERIRRGRYVIIAEPLNVALDPDDRSAYTGTLEGTVVDADTEEPLWGAHVWLVDLDLGDVVAPDGSFAVDDLPTGEYLVRFSHVGYRPARVMLSVFPASPQLPPTIRLRAEPIQQTDATVRPDDGPAAAPGLTDLAARQASALPVALGEGDLVQTLDWMPGLTRASAGGGALVVRGADPQLTRYIKDGVPVLDPWHAFGVFSSFQPEALARVRFHRGTLPAEMSGGLAGVIEMESKDGFVDAPEGIVALTPVGVRGVSEAKLSPTVGFFAAGRASVLSGLFAPTLRRESAAVVLNPLEPLAQRTNQDTAHDLYDAEARLTWVPSTRQRLSLGGSLTGDHLTGDLADGLIRTDTLRLRVGDERLRRTLSARYRLLGRRAFLTATAYHTRYDGLETILARDADARRFERDYRVGFHETALTLDVDYFRSLAHQFRFGLHVDRQVLDADFSEVLTQSDTRRRDEAASAQSVNVVGYVQDAWKPGERWQVQAGLRAGLYADARYVFFSPRLHARYTARPERLYLRAGLSHAVETLHRVRDRYAYTYDLAASQWLLVTGSSFVRPATAWQFGIGTEWVPLPGVALSADGYLRLMNDVLEPVDPFGVGEALAGPGVEESDLLRFYRPSEGRAAGLEIAARTDHGPWQFGLSYALGRAEVQVPGLDGWQPSRYDRPHVLGLLVQRRGAHWSAAARFTVQSGLPAAGLTADEPLTRFPAETRLDVGVGYRFDALGFRWDMQAQAMGLLTRTSLDAPALPDGTAALLATDVRGLPVVPVLSLKASW